jgi:fructokinase
VTAVRIGIDLGGTKIEIVALDDSGDAIFRRRVATPRSYDDCLEAICGLVKDAEGEIAGTGSVGIGIPGTISPLTGLVKNANSTWLIGHPLDKDLSDRLKRRVRVANDANCFVLSEATDGAGAGASVVFGVILGTGVGGGIVVDGKLVEGPQRIAGEWGHTPLPSPLDEERPGPECYCGRKGCIETFLSGPGLERDFRLASGRELAADAISDLAESGDSKAVASMERYVERLGRALATVINIIDPDVVVLGGGVSNLPHLAAKTEQAIKPHVFTDHVTTPVRRNLHGDASGVRGAAWL